MVAESTKTGVTYFDTAEDYAAGASESQLGVSSSPSSHGFQSLLPRGLPYCQHPYSNPSTCAARSPPSAYCQAALAKLSPDARKNVVIGSKVLPNHCGDIRKYCVRATFHPPFFLRLLPAPCTGSVDPAPCTDNAGRLLQTHHVLVYTDSLSTCADCFIFASITFNLHNQRPLHVHCPSLGRHPPAVTSRLHRLVHGALAYRQELNGSFCRACQDCIGWSRLRSG
jgi:hypothetical protein